MPPMGINRLDPLKIKEINKLSHLASSHLPKPSAKKIYSIFNDYWQSRFNQTINNLKPKDFTSLMQMKNSEHQRFAKVCYSINESLLSYTTENFKALNSKSNRHKYIALIESLSLYKVNYAINNNYEAVDYYSIFKALKARLNFIKYGVNVVCNNDMVVVVISAPNTNYSSEDSVETIKKVKEYSYRYYKDIIKNFKCCMARIEEGVSVDYTNPKTGKKSKLFPKRATNIHLHLIVKASEYKNWMKGRVEVRQKVKTIATVNYSKYHYDQTKLHNKSKGIKVPDNVKYKGVPRNLLKKYLKTYNIRIKVIKKTNQNQSNRDFLISQLLYISKFTTLHGNGVKKPHFNKRRVVNSLAYLEGIDLTDAHGLRNYKNQLFIKNKGKYKASKDKKIINLIKLINKSKRKLKNNYVWSLHLALKPTENLKQLGLELTDKAVTQYINSNQNTIAESGGIKVKYLEEKELIAAIKEENSEDSTSINMHGKKVIIYSYYIIRNGRIFKELCNLIGTTAFEISYNSKRSNPVSSYDPFRVYMTLNKYKKRCKKQLKRGKTFNL
jgi:hypothetical protein